MTRTELIKARVTPRLKEVILKLAKNDDTTISDLVRDMMQQLATGRSISPEVRRDMATVRQLGNAALTCAEALVGDPEVARKLADIGTRLREMAARHLGPLP